MKKGIACLLFVLLHSNPAVAEPSDVVLPEVVVTADRMEEPLQSTPQDVTVINRADIEKENVPFVIDLLRLQPDILVQQSGGPGTVATLLMRGSHSNQVLVMVDGIPFNNPSYGSIDLSSFMTSDVERIEIIKGPQSTLYGSEAMDGVVNIITRKGAGEPKADFSIEGGSFSTLKANGTASGATDRTDYRLTAAFYESDGLPIAKYGSVPNNPSKLSVSGRFGVNPNDFSSVELNLRYETDRTNIDNDSSNPPYLPVDTYRYVQNHQTDLVAVTGKIKPWEIYEQSLTLSYLWDDVYTTDPLDQFGDYTVKTATQYLDWQHTLLLRPVTITGGLSYRVEGDDEVGSINESIYSRAGYLNARTDALDDRLTLTAGMRYDNYSAFGDALTYRTGLLYDFKPWALRFKANLGTGFRAPTPDELYYPLYGNPYLNPEKNTGYDAGIEKDFLDKNLVIGATGFVERYNNLIENNSIGIPYNIGNAQTKGVELKGTGQPIHQLKLNAAYTYLEAVDRDTDTFIPYQTRKKAMVSAEFIAADLTLILEYRYVSSRYDGSASENLSPYSLVNLRGSCRVSKYFSIFARIDNLFNTDYEEYTGYNTPGISMFGGIKVSL